MSKTANPLLSYPTFSSTENIKIAIIGLGYVGLPLAAEFARKYTVIGFDINKERIVELMSGHDHTLEVGNNQLLEVVRSEEQLKHNATGLFCTNENHFLTGCNVFII